MNYDLYGMTAREILALLPREFAAWMAEAGPSRPMDVQAAVRLL